MLWLRAAPLISQNDPALVARGLVPPGEASMLCGPTCGHYLMEALRKTLGVPSRFDTAADEIEAMAKVGYSLGRNVARDGMNIEGIRTAISGTIALHGIPGRAEVVTPLVMQGGNMSYENTILKRPRLEIRDFLPPPGQEQGNLIGIKPLNSSGSGHVMTVNTVDAETGIVVLTNPGLPEQEIFLQLLHRDPADPESALLLVPPGTRASDLRAVPDSRLVAVDFLLRVRIDGGHR